MAIRGHKPKVAHLRLLEGNPGHRPIKPDPMVGAAAGGIDNGLEPPRKLKARPAELWRRYIRRAPWLTALDVPRAFMWVELHAEFEKAPSKMIASRIGQLRALGSELGLDPASRARMGGPGANGKASKFDGLIKA